MSNPESPDIHDVEQKQQENGGQKIEQSPKSPETTPFDNEYIEVDDAELDPQKNFPEETKETDTTKDTGNGQDLDMKIPEIDEATTKAMQKEKDKQIAEKTARIFEDKDGFDVVNMQPTVTEIAEEEKELMNKLEQHEQAEKTPQEEVKTFTDLSQVPLEERPYFVKNSDTGEFFDIRVKKPKAPAPRESINKGNKQKAWGSYWSNIYENNVKLWNAAEKGNMDDLKVVLDPSKQKYLPSINARLFDDWTALHLAVNEGHCNVIPLLLDRKAAIEAGTKNKRTPLHIACIRGKTEVVRLLVEKGASVNCEDEDHATPLHYAAEYGHIDVVEYLLGKRADPNLRNRFNQRPIECASDNEIIKIFTSKGFKKEPQDLSPETRKTVNKNKEGDTPTQAGRMTLMLDRSKYLAKHELKYQVFIQSINKTMIRPGAKVGPHSFICHYMLGKGSFGEVYLVEKPDTGKYFAMKVLKKDKVVNQNLHRYAKTERNVLSLMNHPFIVRLNYAFQTDTKLYLILDYCPGGDLGHLITKRKKLPEDIARMYLCEILLGLEELHRNMIVFRDLKPDNVVIDEDGHALLTDFGLSKEGVEMNISRSFCGSIAYLAPEVLKKMGHNRTVDWYLLGVLLYEMIVGIPPYFSANREELFDNILTAPLKLPKHISDNAKDLIKKLLNRTPSARLGANGDAEEIKVHPFFKDINWDDVYHRRLKPPLPDKRIFKGPALNKPINDALPSDPSKTRNHIAGWSFIIPE